MRKFELYSRGKGLFRIYGYSVRWIVKVKRSGENFAWIGVTEIDFSKIIGGYQWGKGLFLLWV